MLGPEYVFLKTWTARDMYGEDLGPAMLLPMVTTAVAAVALRMSLS